MSTQTNTHDLIARFAEDALTSRDYSPDDLRQTIEDAIESFEAAQRDNDNA